GMTAPALQGIGLSRHYGGFAALRNVDIDVPAGEIRGLIGPNGAGKSTTMKMVTGFLDPTSGSIAVGGKDLTKDPLAATRLIG
ncbi:ATP-binding cassette domain-containing protein, partial [Acinetobacter baumannii]